MGSSSNGRQCRSSNHHDAGTRRSTKKFESLKRTKNIDGLRSSKNKVEQNVCGTNLNNFERNVKRATIDNVENVDCSTANVDTLKRSTQGRRRSNVERRKTSDELVYVDYTSQTRPVIYQNGKPIRWSILENWFGFYSALKTY